MIAQSFNNKSNAWVKIKKFPDGKTKIINVKQRNPTKKFKGVKVL